MGQLRDRSLHFTSEGIALIEEAMQGKDWDKGQLAEQVEISYESICRYLRGERPPQRKNIEIIAKRLGLKPIDLVNPDEWISSTKASETKTSLVDWRSVSKGMLDNLKRLTTEALTAGDGIRFDFDDVFEMLSFCKMIIAKKENGVVITSSPAPIPSDLKPITSASVPELTAIACLTPKYAATSCSNCLTSGPIMN
jgi:transcriptional regulator with XRE-family HTH domain